VRRALIVLGVAALSLSAAVPAAAQATARKILLLNSFEREFSPYSDVARIMRGLDLFVLPSLGEGISNTILEAMASGLPVVATDVGGNPELLQEGRTGSLVPAADPRAMAEAMLRYCGSPAECARQGAEARRTVEEKFSMGAMVNNYIAVYDRALRRDMNAGRN